MFLKVSLFILILSLVIWYLHEQHTTQFMAVTRNIPLLTPLMVNIHSYLSSGHKNKTSATDFMFTAEELALYNGKTGSKGLYICILGSIFDVESGRKHYEEGGTYHVFAGRDASRAYVTGDFGLDNASDDVLDLTNDEILSIDQWRDFYDKEYIYKGKLIGRYYTKTGEKTDYHKVFDGKVEEALSSKDDREAMKKKFPPCNTEWSEEKGSRVWCSSRSGGIERDWSGVPRKLYEVGSDKHRCVCIDLPRLQDPTSPQHSRRHNLEIYAGCDTADHSCRVIEK